VEDEMGNRRVFSGIGVILVGGVVYWLTELDGSKWLRERFQGPVIEIRSTSSPVAAEFLADEKLTFVLRRARGHNVYWIFDETTIIPAGLSVDHASVRVNDCETVGSRIY
jgi:hypothetical protein